MKCFRSTTSCTTEARACGVWRQSAANGCVSGRLADSAQCKTTWCAWLQSCVVHLPLRTTNATRETARKLSVHLEHVSAVLGVILAHEAGELKARELAQSGSCASFLAQAALQRENDLLLEAEQLLIAEVIPFVRWLSFALWRKVPRTGAYLRAGSDEGRVGFTQGCGLQHVVNSST